MLVCVLLCKQKTAYEMRISDWSSDVCSSYLMMLGAQGAWFGSAFLATDEAGIEQFQKEAITESGDADTVVSRSLTGKPARMIRNKWADAWVAAGKEPLPMPYQSMVSGPVMASGIKAARKIGRAHV